MKNIVVIFGGESVEHDVSVITGITALDAVDRTLFNVIPVYIDRFNVMYTGKELFDLDGFKNLKPEKLKKVAFLSGSEYLYQIKNKKLKKLCQASCVLNCCHGGGGEGGDLSGLINQTGIALCSPSALSSSVCYDKYFTKTVLRGLGVNVLTGKKVKNLFEFKKAEKEFSYPVIVKPNQLGSSIGITKAKTRKQAEEGVLLALRYGEYALIEPCLENFTEINCAAYKKLNGEIAVSECERPVAQDEFLSFKDKYVKGVREFPAKIDKEISDRIKETTKLIYEKLNFFGVIRVDFMVNKDGIYVGEINTVPGSLSYYLFTNTLKKFSAILTEIINGAIAQKSKESTFIKNYDGGILSGGIKGGKGTIKKET